MARPKGQSSKMKIWTDALQKVLETRKIIFITDEDLVLLVNREIKKTEKDSPNTISHRQFRRWKAGEIENDYAQEFLETLQLAYIEMKDVVGEKLMNEPNFTRWAWILERKFSKDFALVHKSENINRQETIIQIEAGSEQKRNLIEAIRNGQTITAYTEVEPIKIPASSADNTKNDDYDF